MKKLVFGVLVALVVFGCARENPDAPPRIRYGQDECVLCGMIVSDERHAAALRITEDGRQRDLFFDDIGDLIEYERDNADLQVTRRYVHDFKTRQWLDASTAHFVQTDGVHTPMGSGIVAFADPAHAEAQKAEKGGKLLSFAKLPAAHFGSDAPCCATDKDKPSPPAAVTAKADDAGAVQP